MSEKRRDNRNRILREGEYQRKDGRYRFRYIDEDGKEKNVYSWRLDKNDPMPKGKKREPSLREKEKQIEADLFDRIVTNGGNYTVLELVEKYVSLKTGVRHNTVAGYKTVINMLKKESFGNLRIDKVRLSDAKAWLIKLQQIDGRGYSSIHSIRGVLRPAFQMAVDDDLLRKNPFEFELASVIVLIGRAAASLLGVELKRLVKAKQRVLLNTGHELVARRLDGGMQGNGKRELLWDVGKFANSGNNAAGRDGEMTSADTDAIGVVEDSQRLENLVVVGKRLTLAHEDYARGALAKVVGYMKYLVDDLLSGQRALEAVETGSAKGAAHAAACLGGNADRKLVTAGHADSLDGNAVVVLEQILARAIFGNLLG